MSYQSLVYHIILRTARSQRSITEIHERELYRFLYGFMKEKKIDVLRIGGMPDHIHILASIPPNLAIAQVIGEMKRSSSIFMKNERHHFPYFEGWSKSYAVFSYAQRDKETILNYIKHQKEHHQKHSLEDELRQIFKEEAIPIDERFFLKD